jgi:dTDP-L-rhamnose 4-epimerase
MDFGSGVRHQSLAPKFGTREIADIMRVLVTGGAGFIGGHLVDRLLREGFQVRILDNLEPKVHPLGLPDYVPARAEFIPGDVTDRKVLLAALQGVDVVSHQAAYQDYMPDFSRFLTVNAVSTALLFELIVGNRLPVKKIIVASSQAVYGEGQYQCSDHQCPNHQHADHPCADHGGFQPPPRSPRQLHQGEWEISCPACGGVAQPLPLEERSNNPYNQYAVSKLAQEKTALGLGWLHGIPTVALRYSITQGRRQSLYNHYSGVCRIFCSRALRQLPLLVYEDGHQTRDFVHVDDVVEANMLALENDQASGHAFNVGSGRPTMILEYANCVLSRIPSPAGIEVCGEYRRGDNRHSVSSVEKLKGLGWRPKRGLDDILDDFVDWVASCGGVPAHLPDAAADMRAAGVLLSATS